MSMIPPRIPLNPNSTLTAMRWLLDDKKAPDDQELRMSGKELYGKSVTIGRSQRSRVKHQRAAMESVRAAAEREFGEDQAARAFKKVFGATQPAESRITVGNVRDLSKSLYISAPMNTPKVAMADQLIGTKGMFDCSSFVYRGNIGQDGRAGYTILCHCPGSHAGVLKMDRFVKLVNDQKGPKQGDQIVLVTSPHNDSDAAIKIFRESCVENITKIPSFADKVSFVDRVYCGVSEFTIDSMGHVDVLSGAEGASLPRSWSAISKADDSA